MVECVLLAVEQVPAGCAVSYGDIAELVGTLPRRVGTIMSAVGDEVPWWRVTNAAGRLPEHLTAEAVRCWAEERTPMRGGRCLLSQARPDLARWAADYESQLQEITRLDDRR
ncbi:MAG: MGMT family protein [Propionibacteriaceae bacterium]|nr:MGMT family protein [Propionibacteriaceae bacterium]